MNIIHVLHLSKEKIKMFNLCRLHKRITFVSQLFDHNLRDLEHYIFHPDIRCESNERFPQIEIPPNYWSLWKNLIQTVRRSQQIPIHTIGNAISKQHSPWLSTKDKIYTYAKRGKQYAGFSLQHVTKIQYYYTNKILFQTKFENVDHLDHITVHFHSNQ